METARGAKKSAFYDRLAAHGAYSPRRQRMGRCRLVCALREQSRRSRSSRGIGRTGFRIGGRAQGEREGVIVMDMSFMAKFIVQGRDAGRVLNYISANNVDGPAGMITYTQWLDEGGKLQADLTVTKLSDEKFWVVASDTAHRPCRHVDAPAHRR
jgi:4-methylaminobutanoate oxidase (formaldehyde-forming)